MNVTITLSDAITALIAEKRAVGYKYGASEFSVGSVWF